MLRDFQNQNIQESFKSVQSNEVSEDHKAKHHLRPREEQLVSEVGDKSEDVGMEMKLRVPLENMNDAIYQGTIYLGSPES